jgi:putative membrane protein
MKNLFNVFMISVVISAFTACSSTKSTTGSDVDSTANTNAAGTDTTASNLNTPAGPTALASGNVQTTAPDTVNAIQFILEAGASGMKEVELSKLAVQKGVNQGVKAFGTMMVSDHTKANAELKTLADSRNVVLIASPDAATAATSLAKLSGKDFDLAYVKMMIEDHTKAVDMFNMATRSSDPEIKAYATKYLPTLKTHLTQVSGLSK